MKFLPVTVFFVILSVSVLAGPRDDCAEKLGLKKYGNPDGKDGCVDTCQHVSLGFMNPDFTLNVEGQLDMFKRVAEVSQGMATEAALFEIADTCRNVAKGKDQCDAWRLAKECMKVEELKRGIEF